MSEILTYPVPDETRARAFINNDRYTDWYRQSIDDRENFWADRANELIDWSTPWNKVVEEDLAAGQVKWFLGATTNVAYNCLDRHLATRGD